MKDSSNKRHFVPNAQFLINDGDDDISIFGFRFPDSKDNTLPNKFSVEVNGFKDIMSDINKIVRQYANWKVIKI